MDNAANVLRHQEVNAHKPEQAASVAISSSKETVNFFLGKMNVKLTKLKKEAAAIKTRMSFFKKGYQTIVHANTVLKIKRLAHLRKDPDSIKWLKDAKLKGLIPQKIQPMRQFIEWLSRIIQVDKIPF